MENSPIDFDTEKRWKNESNDRLKDRGSPNRILNMNYIYIAFVLVGVGMVGVFYYLGTNNYLKGNLSVNNTCESCPAFPSIPSCPSCVNNCNLTCGNSNSTIVSNITNIINNTIYNST